MLVYQRVDLVHSGHRNVDFEAGVAPEKSALGHMLYNLNNL